MRKVMIKNEKELIQSFYYNGYDISNYINTTKVLESDNDGFIDGNDYKAIATIRTFSCTNILFYSDNFAYLVHMLPSETIGKNDKFLTRIEKVKEIINNKNPNQLNILISLGASIDDKKMGFHNLDYINSNIKLLTNFCEENNIELNMLPFFRSKFLLFDLVKKRLIIENNEKKIIDIKTLEVMSEKLTKNRKIK